MGVVAGDILIDIANKHEEIWMWKNIGLFAGADLRFNFGRFFFQSNVEYDFYPMTNQYGDILINAVNISGFNANFTAGTSF